MANSYYERDTGDDSTDPVGTSGFNRGSLQNPSRIMHSMSPQRHTSDLFSDLLRASGNPGIDEDFSSLKQENGSLSNQIINMDKEAPSLGDEAIFKVKQKQPGRKDLHQNHAYKDCDITARGQEPQPVPQPVPKSRPDSYQELKSERGPGKRGVRHPRI